MSKEAEVKLYEYSGVLEGDVVPASDPIQSFTLFIFGCLSEISLYTALE